MQRTVKHTFVSSFAKKSGNTWQFDFSEPIRNIVGGRINGVFIKNFLLINQNYVYFLRTDGIFGSRTLTFFNSKPDTVSLTIPNTNIIPAPNPQNGFGIHRLENNDKWYNTNLHNLDGISFQLLGEQGVPIDPPDVGWSFTVEVEYLINN